MKEQIILVTREDGGFGVKTSATAQDLLYAITVAVSSVNEILQRIGVSKDFARSIMLRAVDAGLSDLPSTCIDTGAIEKALKNKEEE